MSPSVPPFQYSPNRPQILKLVPISSLEMQQYVVIDREIFKKKKSTKQKQKGIL